MGHVDCHMMYGFCIKISSDNVRFLSFHQLFPLCSSAWLQAISICSSTPVETTMSGARSPPQCITSSWGSFGLTKYASFSQSVHVCVSKRESERVQFTFRQTCRCVYLRACVEFSVSMWHDSPRLQLSPVTCFHTAPPCGWFELMLFAYEAQAHWPSTCSA